MRRIPAAAFILFALTTGCTRTATTSEPSPSTLVWATTLIPSGTVAARTPTTTKSPAPTLQTTPPEPASTIAIRLKAESPEDAASEFVGALIDGRTPPDDIDSELWTVTLDGGRIIQTTALHTAADRATVAVSIAFDTQPGGEEIEPIGLRIELRSQASGWTVDGIGYL